MGTVQETIEPTNVYQLKYQISNGRLIQIIAKPRQDEN